MSKAIEEKEITDREKEEEMDEDTTMDKNGEHGQDMPIEKETSNKPRESPNEDVIDLNASRDTITTHEEIAEDVEAEKTMTKENRQREKTREETSIKQQQQAAREGQQTPTSEQDRYQLRNTQPLRYKEISEGKGDLEAKGGKKGRPSKGKKTEEYNDQKKTTNPDKQNEDYSDLKEILKETKEQLKTTQKVLTEERRSTKTWKEDKMRIEKEIVILRKTLARTSEEVETKDKYIQEGKTKQEELKEANEKLRKKVKELEIENKKIKNERDKLTKEIETTKGKNEDQGNEDLRKAKITEQNKEIERLRSEVEEIRKELEREEKEKEDLKMKAQENKEEKAALVQQIKELRKISPSTSKQEEEMKIQDILYIADSNRRYIAPYLTKEHTRWNILDHIYTIEDLGKKMEKDAIKDDIKKADRVILMLGTNDIRNETMDPDRAAAQLKRNAELIVKQYRKPVTILCPPPPCMGRNPRN